ncbi:MAG TPA: ABC transporter permease, partial [Puia sp.]|nr:ABC transporter permease [Puia sp.]
MISNYFKIAWRNLLSNKILSVIKIGGLGLGLMVCMLILLYNKDEISFDHFHTNKKHIYRVVQTMKIGQDEPNKIGVTQAPLGPAFQKEIPGILLFARVDLTHVTVRKGSDVFTENPLVADTSFFSVFSFSLLKGNPGTALKDAHSVVLSEESAVKYFGTTDVLGKILQVKQNDVFENYTVTGLVENAPQNSSIQYKLILPFESFNANHGWIGGGPNTFLLLSPQAKLADVKHKIQDIFDKNTSEQISKAKETQNLVIKIELDLQGLTDIHLSSSWKADNGLENGSSPTYSYILSCIAFFILIIACINFVNLALAQSLKRGKEIGIRKVVGGTKQQLIWQFMVESLLVSFVSFLLAIVLTSALLPLFNKLADKKLSLAYLADSSLYISYFLLLLLTAFVAGFYPSLVLSRFKPVKVLYGREKFPGKNYFTKGLIVMQFALAIFLMIGSIAIYSQLNFFLHKDLGYKSSNLVKIDLPFSRDNDGLLAVFKNDLKGQPGIVAIGARNRGSMITGAKADGKDVLIDYNKIDDAFFPTYGISFIEGRNFSPAFA